MNINPKLLYLRLSSTTESFYPAGKLSLRLMLFFALVLNAPHASFAQSLPSTTVFRLKSSSPEKLLTGIYNSALIGNDRLSDIEPYMSAGLKGDYKKTVRAVARGKSCDVPRILTNKYFTGKIKGFNVQPAVNSNKETQVAVIINTASENLSDANKLKRFDPAIYEKINFSFVKRFLDWKIDNITSSEPNLDDKSSPPSYTTINLRELLARCR